MMKYSLNLFFYFIFLFYLYQVKSNKYSPSERILSKIDFFSKKKEELREKSAKIYLKEIKKCNNEIEFRRTEINDSKTSLEESNDKLIQCSNSLSILKREIKNTKNSIKYTKNLIQDKLNSKKNKKSSFEKQFKEHNDIINSIQGIYYIIANFENKDEKNNNLDIITQVNFIFINSIKKQNFGNYYLPIFQTIIQIGQTNGKFHFKNENLQKIVNLFEEFEERIKKSLDELILSHEKEEDLFNDSLKQIH